MLYGRFTKRSQRVLVLAQEEAKKLKHPYVGTEHILLGLLDEGEGVAAKSLAALGVQRDQILEMLPKSVNQNEVVLSEIAITPRVKKVLELSMHEAQQMGANYVCTEHLLLGLMQEGEGIGTQLLEALGVDQNKVRQEIDRLLGGVGGSPGQQSGTGCAAENCGSGNTDSILDQFSRDLTVLAKEDKLDPVVGRDQEIERVIQILSRRTKNNPVLIGDPGVGKTAVVEGLAQRIAAGGVPEILLHKRLLTLDLASLVAGTKYRGDFEERLKKVMEEIIQSNEIITFIDELHTIIGAGAAEGALDAANILKPALARGELQCIGATTLDEYRKNIEKDSALERRFQPITVDEPSVEETVRILTGLRDRYEAHHRVRFTSEALEAAAYLSDRYISDRYLPDKAIDLMDEAGARVRLQAFTAPPDMKDLEQRIDELSKEKEAFVNNQEFEQAAQLRDEENKLRQELDDKRNAWRQEKGGEDLEVGEDDIAHIVASWTGIPVRKLAIAESDKLLALEETLHKRVIGQEESVSVISKAIRRARAGLKDPKRPIGSFIFLGPTGVGKTELARALAEALFEDEEAMVRIDMSEYMEKFAVSRLTGAPPGYVGYEEGGQLTEAVRRKPYSVVLLDEIEKAHPDVFNVLLQVLEDGRLTDAQGRTVDFRNTVIIMTSNVGSSLIKKEAVMGFKSEASVDNQYEQMKKKMTDDLRRVFRPEFLNRVDDVIVFHALNKEHITNIVGLMVKDVTNRLEEYGIGIQVSDGAVAYLAKEGFDEEFGARPLRRVIQKEIEDKLSEEMLRGVFIRGDRVQIDVLDTGLTVKKI